MAEEKTSVNSNHKRIAEEEKEIRRLTPFMGGPRMTEEERQQRVTEMIRTFHPVSIIKLMTSQYITINKSFNLLEERILANPDEWKKVSDDLLDILFVSEKTPIGLSQQDITNLIAFLEKLYQLGFDFSKHILSMVPQVFAWRLTKCNIDLDTPVNLYHGAASKTLQYGPHAEMKTPLRFAVDNNSQEENVYRLLALGAEPSLQDKNGITPLYSILKSKLYPPVFFSANPRVISDPVQDRKIHALLLAGTNTQLEVNPTQRNKNTPKSAEELLEKLRQTNPEFESTFESTQEDVKRRMEAIAQEMAPILAACRANRTNGSVARGGRRTHRKKKNPRKKQRKSTHRRK